MELVKDLGMRPRASGGTYRWGLYKCPKCNYEYELAIATINYRKRRGGAKVCHACANIPKAQIIGAIKNNQTRASYLESFIQVHGDRYDYSKFEYIGAWTKSTIICKTHGEFLQAYADHREGHGCPACAKEENLYGLRKHTVLVKPTKLYYIYFLNLNLWKIGCTSNSLAKRFIEDKSYQYEVLYVKEYATGYEAYEVEKWLLRYSKDSQYKGACRLTGGNSELRTKPINSLMQVIKMAESNYKLTKGL